MFKERERRPTKSSSVFDRLGDKADFYQIRAHLYEWRSVGSISRDLSYVPDYSYDDERDGHARSFELEGDDEDLSFSFEIRNTSVPKGFVKPKLEKYTGRGDPMYDLAYYKIEMKLKNALPFLKCMDFHMTLTGAPNMWYLKLKLDSIRS
ncbi:activating signal cointegrator 1 complex subunit 2-like protein [Abeliophyllum distichum]|uniref:Activating signal cointegrator 1 complex subunit 2-like protein n=1 Tax=Abeliophyllum distichum TaxID=126358 RepID=A0ABD1RCG7_9LAMI